MTYSRELLLKELMELAFTIKDLNLYLDTHPTDLNAIAAYNMAVNKKSAAVIFYESLYGPLQVGLSEEKKPHWQWIESPWPWDNMDDYKEREVALNVEL